MTTTNSLVHDDIIHIINQIVKLPDDAVVDAGLAALYLGSSEKSLARYRQHGEGPPYIQYPEAKSKARNQKVNYEMGDLRKWRAKNKITSTMDAAVRRGMAFTRVNDLLATQPKYKVYSVDNTPRFPGRMLARSIEPTRRPRSCWHQALSEHHVVDKHIV